MTSPQEPDGPFTTLAPEPQSAMLTLYGLDNCDTCKKARNWLTRFGIEHRFVDYRKQPLAAATLRDWAGQLGGWERLVNKASTTWRSLPDARRSPGSDPEWTLLLKEHPALIRRPVALTDDGTVGVGFSDNSYKMRFRSPP